MASKEKKETGNFYRVYDSINQIWKRLSFWSDAKDVEVVRETGEKDTVYNILKGIRGIDTQDKYVENQNYGIALDKLTFQDFISSCRGLRFVSKNEYDSMRLTSEDEGIVFFIYED